MSPDRWKRLRRPSLNDARRAEFCRPLTRSPDEDDLFFCALGTMFCTEAHGDYEIPFVEANAFERKRD